MGEILGSRIMIDTDFEKQKQKYMGTDGHTYTEGQNWYNGNRVYMRAKQIAPPPPQKPHWFERFLRWWYDL